MKKEKEYKVVFIGKYDKGEILAGNIKVAKRIFYYYTKKNKSLYIEYFFDGKRHSYFKKLFGSEVVDEVNGSKVLKLGIIKMLIILFKLKPVIVHVVIAERFCAFAYIYRLLKDVKFYFIVHGLHIYEDDKLRNPPKFFKFKNKIAEKIFLKYSDIIFILSKRFQKFLNEYYKIDQSKIKIIPNGIDKTFCFYSQKRADKSENKLNVVFGSDINRIAKGFSFLIDSLKEINYSIDLFILSKKHPLINNYKINSSIKLFFIDRMPTDYLANFFTDKDVFISSSFYEPFNTTAVEAMAVGTVPILSNETGASEYINNGINGFTFDYGDKEKLRSILLYLFENQNVLKEISLKAKEIYKLLSWDKVINVYNKYYEEK